MKYYYSCMYFLSLPIIERKQIAKGVTEVTFGLDDKTIDFEPGQYVRVIVPKLPIPDTRGSSRDFTITSLPNGKNISIAFRSEKKLSGFKQALINLPYGERVTVLGPHGNLTLPKSTSRPLIFIAGGIGITAFATKIHHALTQGEKYHITLLWSSSDEERLPYLSELRELANTHKKQFKLVEVFGTTHRINAKLLEEHLSQKNESIPLWQIAGPQGMVGSMRNILKDLKVKDEDIAYEEYEGYNSAPEPYRVDSPIASISDIDDAGNQRAHLFEGLLEALNRTAIVSKTDAEGKILFINDKFIEVSKYSREELIGQNHRILKSDHHPQEFYRNLWQTISSGRVWRGEIKNRAKDGSYYWVDTSIAPIMGKNGIPERYVSVRFVITDKKEAEEELALHHQNLEELIEERTNELRTANEKLKAHATELAASDRKKDEFIAVLSHELRNPLASAISSIELIALQEEDHPSAMSDAVVTAHTHLRTVARLLDDLLDVSRITRKKFKLQKEVINIQTILHRSIEGIRPFAQNKQLRLNLSIPEEPIWMEADSLRLTQIFGNVLSNAIKYTNVGGTVEVHCVRGEESVFVSIRDNGIGIPKDMLDQIFEMFVQGKTTSTITTGTGLGIGLSLTKRLVELHGGTIEAHSDGEGKGSEFIIHLPVPKVMQIPMQISSPTRKKPMTKQFRILVVDDNEAAAKSLGELLGYRGHTVGLAYGWRDALKEASNGYNVILLDIGMPEMDGYDLARLIIREVTSPPALIALTGFGQEEDKQKALEAGFAYHLTKPIGLADIEDVLMKIPL